eukprot:6212980-Pleurochrysis_carterae.AAC.5
MSRYTTCSFSVMLIGAELEMNAAMNATPSKVDMPPCRFDRTRLKHAFEVPQLLHDPGSALVMRTAQLNFNVVVKNAFLCLRLWGSEEKQMRKFDELCRYMTERYLPRYVSSTRVNSCESFSGFAEAHEVTKVFIKLIDAMERYLEPESTASTPESDSSSDTTLSDDEVVPPAEFPEPEPKPVYAEPMAAVGTAATAPNSVKAHAIARLEKSQDDMQRLMKVMVSQMQQMSTRDKAFQESFLRTMRKEQSANTARLVALGLVEKWPRPRAGGGGRGAGSYVSKQSAVASSKQILTWLSNQLQDNLALGRVLVSRKSEHDGRVFRVIVTSTFEHLTGAFGNGVTCNGMISLISLLFVLRQAY